MVGPAKVINISICIQECWSEFSLPKKKNNNRLNSKGGGRDSPFVGIHLLKTLIGRLRVCKQYLVVCEILNKRGRREKKTPSPFSQYN